eukprot:scaffold175276_cov17-Tisochrysis_lutea.AAC.1
MAHKQSGGLVDVITNPGKSGLMYPPGDYAAAAQMVAQLVADKDMQQQMGANARAEVEKLGWTAATNRLREQQYQRAIDVNRNKQRWVCLFGREAPCFLSEHARWCVCASTLFHPSIDLATVPCLMVPLPTPACCVLHQKEVGVVHHHHHYPLACPSSQVWVPGASRGIDEAAADAGVRHPGCFDVAGVQAGLRS